MQRAFGAVALASFRVTIYSVVHDTRAVERGDLNGLDGRLGQLYDDGIVVHFSV